MAQFAHILICIYYLNISIQNIYSHIKIEKWLVRNGALNEYLMKKCRLQPSLPLHQKSNVCTWRHQWVQKTPGSKPVSATHTTSESLYFYLKRKIIFTFYVYWFNQIAHVKLLKNGEHLASTQIVIINDNCSKCFEQKFESQSNKYYCNVSRNFIKKHRMCS